MLRRSCGLRRGQFEIEPDRDPGCNFVSQREEVCCVAIEPLRPQMRIALGVNQLGVDSDLVAGPLDATYEQVADTDLAADLLCVDRSSCDR
jgi:hypothetical protein